MGCEFYKRTFQTFLDEHKTEVYPTYSDLRAVFINRHSRAKLHISNELLFINCGGNWPNLPTDAIITYNNSNFARTYTAAVDVLNNAEKLRHSESSNNSNSH